MPEFESLRALSAEIGSDPLLVQAAGGNTSIKQDGVMWIKASGTWLRDAMAKDIFVPLDFGALTNALANDDPDCESCLPFVHNDLNANGLRPSIETSVHGLMPQKVVLHVHCVSTIARAICTDAEQSLASLMQPFNWAFVPYARPGLQLARAIRNAMRPGNDVLVLGNHGLAVAADSVDEASALLRRVVSAVNLQPRPSIAPAVEFLMAKASETGFQMPKDEACHEAATDPLAARFGLSKAYYPDHVVFLGEDLPQHATANTMALAFPGKGVLVNPAAKPAVEPMLRCLGDVFRRVTDGSKLKALTPIEIDQLLNWDAEKYRQTLKQ